MLVLHITCICWITDKSNIHKPSRDVATPAINMYADKTLFLTHIEATHTRRQVHCTKKAHTNKAYLPFFLIQIPFFYR